MFILNRAFLFKSRSISSTHKITRHRASRLHRVCSAVMQALEVRQLLSTYYVSDTTASGLPLGVDTNPGSITQPFLTINKAAQVAVAGDTILIGGSPTPSLTVGVYRETITPLNSGTDTGGASRNPITYEPYNNEHVTVSGADLISDSSWSAYSGSTYKASVSTGSLGTNGEDQVFVNGQMMTEAKYPNTPFPSSGTADPSQPVFSKLSSATVTGPTLVSGTLPNGSAGTLVQFTITDSSLTQTTSNYWVGGQMYILPGTSSQQWVAETAYVTAYSYNSSTGKGTITIQAQDATNHSSLTEYSPQTGDRYYLFGKQAALDSASEWFHDTSANTLYLWSNDSANLTTTSDVVEVKKRMEAFDLSAHNAKDITIEGINIFAAGILTSASSNYDYIDNVTATYVSNYDSDNTLMTGGWYGILNTGISLKGTGDQLTNSTVAYSAGNAVGVGGTKDVVQNNIIHDADYEGGDYAAVNGNSSNGTIISNNTIYNSGRSVVSIRSIQNTTITYNDIYNGCLQANDGGGIYDYGGPLDPDHTGEPNGGTSRIAYNIVHDMGAAIADPNYKNSAATTDGGVYLDNYTSQFLIDHNVTYNVPTGFILNRPDTYTRVVNNTFDATVNSAGGYTKNASFYTMVGSMLENNIFFKTIGESGSSLTDSSPGNSDLNKPQVIGSTTYYPGIASLASANHGSTPTTDVVSYTGHNYELSSGSGSKSIGVAYTDSIIAALVSGATIHQVTAVSSGSTDDGAAFEGGNIFTVGNQAPTSLNATAVSASQINLTWNFSSIYAYAFTLQRATNATFTTGLTSYSPAAGATSYSDTTGLVAGTTYYYRIMAVVGGAWSPASTDNATTPSGVPAALPGLAAVTASSSQINLTWTDNSNNETSFNIDHATNSTFTTGLVTTTAPANATSSSITGLTAGTTYYFRVRAANGSGQSSNSNTANAITITSAPTGLSATPGNGQIGLSWIAPTGAATYNIYRSTTSGGEGSTAYATSSINSYTDFATTNGVVYYYKVAAVNSGGTSGQSSEANAQPSSFTSLDINAGVTGSTSYNSSTGVYTINGGGTDIWGTADGFRFMYESLSGDGEIVARVDSLTANGSSYTKGGVMIRDSLASGAESAFMDIQLPNSTTNIADFLYRTSTNGTTAYTGSGSASISLAEWVKLTRVSNLFSAYYSSDGSTWTLLGSQTIAMGTNTYIGVAYTGKSTTTLGTGTFDNITVGPVSPTALAATAVSSSEIDLSWTDNSSNETGFELDRATNSTFTSGLTTFSLAANTTSYNDTTLSASTTYYYRLRSTNSLGDSENSATASATTSAASSSVFSGISEAGSPSTPAAIASNLQIGSLEYSDRTYAYSSVVTSGSTYDLTGADFIQTANANKSNASYSITYTLAQNAQVFILIWKANLPTLPTGMSAFTDTGETLNGSSAYEVFTATQSAGSYTIGSEVNPNNFYTIIALPAASTNRFASLSETAPSTPAVINSNLQTGDLEYIDRTYTWSSLVSSGSTYDFTGADFIQTANSDKSVSTYSLSYTLSTSSYVYILIWKANLPTLPTGMTGFSDTGETLTSGGYEIFRKLQSAGAYTLGSEVNPNNFYTLFAMGT